MVTMCTIWEGTLIPIKQILQKSCSSKEKQGEEITLVDLNMIWAG